MGIGISLDRSGASLKTSFLLTADFEMATENPLHTDRSPALHDSGDDNFLAMLGSNPCADQNNALCVRSTISVELGVVVGKPTNIYMTFDLESTGVWLEPLKMRGFGLADAAFSLGVKLQVTTVVIPSPPFLAVTVVPLPQVRLRLHRTVPSFMTVLSCFPPSLLSSLCD